MGRSAACRSAAHRSLHIGCTCDMLRACIADVHGVVQLASSQGWHADRDHRGGLSQRTQADAAAGDHLRRTAAQAGPRQDAHPQAVQRQQGAAVHREQRRQARLHRLRRFVLLSSGQQIRWDLGTGKIVPEMICLLCRMGRNYLKTVGRFVMMCNVIIRPLSTVEYTSVATSGRSGAQA